MNQKTTYDYYDCGICGAYHLWEWAGDCRDDKYRLSDVPGDADIACMCERVEADGGGFFERCEMCEREPA